MVLAIAIVLAIYVAWNLGANDVANSMGTSVGSKAITFGQAIAIAGVLEFSGAVLFGQRVSSTLVNSIVDPTAFHAAPNTLVIGMLSVLLACGLWVQIATRFGLPVSSSHAIVGAIAGFGGVALGLGAIAWKTIGVISLTWIATPVMSGAIAAGFYALIQRWILAQPDPANQIQQLYEWIPWLSAAVVGVFGTIVLPTILTPSRLDSWPISSPAIMVGIGAIAILGISWSNWRSLHQQIIHPSGSQTSPVESLFARFQLLSACFVAFAHGSNDVGNAVAPLAAIAYIQATHTVPASAIAVPTWVLWVGGGGIVAGLAIGGKRVIHTIGESIISLQPSHGFCAELATATTVLLASHVGLPVSTSHALVGAVVGVGWVRQSKADAAVNLAILRQIVWVWVITIPISAGLSACFFSVARAIAL